MKYSYKLILALCIIGLFSGCTIEIEIALTLLSSYSNEAQNTSSSMSA